MSVNKVTVQTVEMCKFWSFNSG